jgi:hypothetical protein
MKMHSHQEYVHLLESFPIFIDEENKQKIIANLQHFTGISEDFISECSQLSEDLIHKAILQFHSENRNVAEKKLFPDFDENEDYIDFTRNTTVLLMLMKQFWFYNLQFEQCIKKNTDHATGLGDKSLFITALDL